MILTGDVPGAAGAEEVLFTRSAEGSGGAEKQATEP